MAAGKNSDAEEARLQEFRQGLARRITDARGDMSKQKLARISGVSVATISRIEAATRNTSVEKLAALARALNVTIDDLTPSEGLGGPGPGAGTARRLPAGPSARVLQAVQDQLTELRDELGKVRDRVGAVETAQKRRGARSA
jgi:transcriptional regulator with XRE-family HTH domain